MKTKEQVQFFIPQESIYRSTTVPKTQRSSKAVGFHEKLITTTFHPLSAILEEEEPERERISTVNDDNIHLEIVTALPVDSKSLAKNHTLYDEEKVETSHGKLVVAVQGERSKPAIITYHDLGLNHIANFQNFFNFSETKSFISNFCVYHVNAPGQEEGAKDLPHGFVYPTMDELAEQLVYIVAHFNLTRIIGLGVGVGANILARFATKYPEKVKGLILINTVSTAASWNERWNQKLNAYHLNHTGMGQGTLDYLMDYFGLEYQERQHDLHLTFREYLARHVNPRNLALFINSYIERSDLGITRPDEKHLDLCDYNPFLEAIQNIYSYVQRYFRPVSGMSEKKTHEGCQMPVSTLNITGAYRPHKEAVVTFNSRLDPTRSDYVECSDCSMVLEEQPAKIIKAMKLFLQGIGFYYQNFTRFNT
ncbi:protein NDRG3-like [Artemia franciscana]|uniref:protein NDRG3-like n=1 Tax=Artemia franciscana TaxID=6661 RepID=UPI0032DBABCB